MGKVTHIDWCDSTCNFWIGCQRVSQGCLNCYADREMSRYGRNFRKVVRTQPATFNAPLKWKEPRRIFTCSWSDFFIEEADPWRNDAWDIIRRTPHHTWMILTKRPERIMNALTTARVQALNAENADLALWLHDWIDGQPPANVWLGVSAENQKYADIRIPQLLTIPARVHFLSAEPLLGFLDIRNYLSTQDSGLSTQHLAWVIVGGESGPRARPMHPIWAQNLRTQCLGTAAYFFKQWGEWSPLPGHESNPDRTEVTTIHMTPDGQTRDRQPMHGPVAINSVPLYRWGKHQTGNRLDGRKYEELPP